MSKKTEGPHYDIVIVGAGHAGCEAALASSRIGLKTLLLTLNLDNVAQMSCNPSIGGLAKGHLVREIDALGGEMAKVIDRTGIQFRMLNTGKGQAVQAIRAQADKKTYQRLMRRTLESQQGLELKQGTVVRISPLEGTHRGRIAPPGPRPSWKVETEAGISFVAKCLILTPGTFLNGRIHIGLSAFPGGRAGELSAPHLSNCLEELGFELGRLKTGTSPRLARRSIDFSRVEPQFGDEPPPLFSHFSTERALEQVPCHVTWTNEGAHRILRENLERSPLFSGRIKGIGPRYCPSIEDKVMKFPEREAHQIFLEPEGIDSEEIYASGISTSMPVDVQQELVHSIEGLEHAEIMRPGYAVEYDFVPPTYLAPTLQTKPYPTLFLAGQINGTSGYEEAAAQGLIAGINAALLIEGKAPLVLDRTEAYIGVMIDDLVSRGTREPYRMFTSQAEYRLLLRHDNADERLLDYGHGLGLIRSEDYERCRSRIEAVDAEIERLEKSTVSPEDVHGLLQSVHASAVRGSVSLGQLLKRPEISYGSLVEHGLASRPAEIGRLVEIRLKYAGYIARQNKGVERFRKMEGLLIPEELFSEELSAISKEGREKLLEVRPRSIGQASRLAGFSPSDVSALLIYLKKKSLAKKAASSP
jgi:tRNA uridine 5-carboxymethylaminomethyl modification enzyme